MKITAISLINTGTKPQNKIATNRIKQQVVKISK